MASTKRLRPPSRFGDLGQLREMFEAARPQLLTEMAGLFVKRTPKLTRKETRGQAKRLDRFLRSSRPYLIGLWFLNHPEDREQCFYALFEGLFKEQIRAGGRSIAEDQDAFEYLLKMTAKQCWEGDRAFAQSTPYIATKRALYDLLVFLHQTGNPYTVETLMGEWGASKEARKYLQSAALWPTAAKRLRRLAPKRLTPTIAAELAREYSWSCAFFEQRLRLLVWLESGVHGNKKPWPEFQKSTLAVLGKLCESNPRLKWVGGLVDRHVRNALAHGQPELNMDRQQCAFHDREHTVTWSIGEFFDKTRSLTLAVRAMMEFETLLRFVQVQALASAVWSRAEVCASTDKGAGAP